MPAVSVRTSSTSAFCTWPPARSNRASKRRSRGCSPVALASTTPPSKRSLRPRNAPSPTCTSPRPTQPPTTACSPPEVLDERRRQRAHRSKLPTMASECVRRFRDAGHDAALPVFLETLEAELGERRVRRCDRLLRASRLPPGKTFETLDEKRLPKGVTPRLRELASGAFLERAANVLCFGLPGTGKTHAACALGHALVRRGHAVLFTPTFQLVQELLAAKRDLALPRALRKLDAFEVII